VIVRTLIAIGVLVALLPGSTVEATRRDFACNREYDPQRHSFPLCLGVSWSAQSQSRQSNVVPGSRSSKEDVNRRNPDGSTPLQWAVYNGDLAEVRRLLRAGADVTLANHYGATPMSLAADVANTEMLKLLLEAGANVESPNADGQTALHAVARTGNVEAAKLLLEQGAAVDAKEKFGGQTPLMWASARRHPEMMRLLISKGADVNARSIDRNYQRHVTAEGRPKNLDSGGLTPLLYAARENCAACVDVLLQNKADIDLPDPDGVSPLLLAIMNANWDLAKQLILAGADVNQWDMFGESPLITAVDQRTRIDGGRASIDPPNATSGVAIVKLLLERGADPNMQLFFKPANARGAVQTRGVTALIRAANNGDLEAVKLLLEHGADATIATADRQTAIHSVLAGRAPEPQALELIRVLQKAGADVNVVALINHPEEIRGGTALHYAVRKRFKTVIKELASFGIDMNAVDQDGLTALDYTQSRGFMPFMALQTPVYKEEAQLLRDLGATKLMAKSPMWPVLGPPQGVWEDIWPLGETAVHEPVYKPTIESAP
jgi:ankyrin repeat protein